MVSLWTDIQRHKKVKCHLEIGKCLYSMNIISTRIFS